MPSGYREQRPGTRREHLCFHRIFGDSRAAETVLCDKMHHLVFFMQQAALSKTLMHATLNSGSTNNAVSHWIQRRVSLFFI